MLKRFLVNIARTKQMQGLWARLKHLSVVNMNYYGGSDLFESGEIAVLEHVAEQIKAKQNPVVFDVGANTGKYLKEAKQILPTDTKFYCFEPSQRAYDELKLVAANAPNIFLLQLGLGEKEEVLKLRGPGSGSVLNSLHVFNEGGGGTVEEIQIATIDKFCAEKSIDQIDFLKMDIEGHEVAALSGARKMISEGKVWMVQFEFGQPNIASKTYLKDFYTILGDKYSVYRIVRDGFVPLGKYSEENEVFLTANYFAVLKS
ncbi:MAG: hypothetical protein JWO06_2337 [Bacteroidota bacterium]|nr:hypothetical protein [Bacteroidota bacterium]